MKIKILALATLLYATPAAAQLDVKISNFTHNRGISTATLTIVNNTQKHITSIYGECAFLDKGKKPIDIGPFNERNIQIGQTVYAQASIASNVEPETADCRIESVR